MDTNSLLDLWNTRPVRRRHGKTIAGVCTGIGLRYRIDPTLVKVAFVVAAIFGGSGVFLYIACLIALPAEDETAPRRLTRRPHRHLRGFHEIPWYWIVVVVIGAVALGNMGSSSPMWGGSSLLGLVLLLGGWWLLYQRTPQAPAGTSVDQLPTTGGVPVGAVAAGAVVPPVSEYPPIAVPTPDASTVSLHKSGTIESDPVETSSIVAKSGAVEESDAPSSGPETPGLPPRDDAPPAWDPLGAAPFAWDLPEPATPPPPPARKPPKSRVTSVFAGLALLVATVSTAANVVGGVEWFTVGRIAALALAILGVGMLVDAVRPRPAGGRAAGLVPLAMMVGVVAIIGTLFAAGRPSLPEGGVGERSWHPQSVQELADEYHLTVGTSTLDLRDVGPLDRDRTVRVRQGIGDLTVFLPKDVRVKVECNTVVADQKCPSVVNADAKTPTLTIKADLSVGSVEMK